jgi:hypothetical protein
MFIWRGQFKDIRREFSFMNLFRKNAFFLVFCVAPSAVFAQEQTSNSTGVMVREIEYASPAAPATPCPTAEPGGAPVVCVEADPRDALKTFKMNVPADWDVRMNDGVNALFMEPKEKAVATPENPVVADPNMSVKVTKNPIPIDERGLAEFAEDIEAGLNRTDAGVENPAGRLFKVFGKSIVSLPQGHKAYLYYVQGKINDISVRQAILVASTQSVRFRVQLTDTEQNFDKSLEKYFPVLTSLQLSGSPMERPSTFLAVLPWVLGFAGIIGFFLALKMVRIRNTRRLIEEIEDDVSASEKTSRVPKTSSKSEYPDFDD